MFGDLVFKQERVIYLIKSMLIKKGKLRKIFNYYILKIKCVVCFCNFFGVFENI